VYLVEKLAARLNSRPEALRAAGQAGGWRLHVMHRELTREGSAAMTQVGVTLMGATRGVGGQGEAMIDRPAPGRDGADGGVVTDDSLGAWPLPAQAQEA